jgi:hypothetical protein
MINTELLYTLPPFKDPGGFPINISLYPEIAKSFISINDKTIKFAPRYGFQLGTYQISIVLTN